VSVVCAAEIFSKNWQLLSVLSDTSCRGSCSFAPVYPDQANARIVYFRPEVSQSTPAYSKAPGAAGAIGSPSRATSRLRHLLPSLG
jgi:hypothetical protein